MEPRKVSQRHRTIFEARGNGSLVVLVDSAQPEFLQLPLTLFSALAHFGLPYIVRDISRNPLTAADLAAHPAVVIAQEHFGLCLRSSDARELLGAVEEALGKNVGP